jgi:hypothetical protein
LEKSFTKKYADVNILKEEEKKRTFTVFSTIVSPFNGYIARFLGGFPQQFVTNLIGFAIQKGGPRSADLKHLFMSPDSGGLIWNKDLVYI